MKGYRTVVADPPWPYKDANKSGSALARNRGIKKVNELGYDVLSIEDLCSMSIESVVRDDAHLYVWTTNSFMVEAHQVARAWGFEPKTIITWAKVKKGTDCNPSMKTGYYFRSATEHVLFCIRGSLRLRDTKRGYPTWFPHERLSHSRKPDYLQEQIEANWSYAPYLELFARRQRPGWDAWGKEVESSIEIPLGGARV